MMERRRLYMNWALIIMIGMLWILPPAFEAAQAPINPIEPDPTQLPDLVPHDGRLTLSSSPESIYALEVVVSNIGDASSNGGENTLFFEDTLSNCIGSTFLYILSPGDSQSQKIPYNWDGRTHTIIVICDYYNETRESNEKNNQYTFTIP